jgi:hypothetical protein
MEADRREEHGRGHLRVRRVRAWVTLLASVPLLAIAPASVAATSQNAAATHAYLLATNSFAETELSNLTQDTAAREAMSAQISSECSGTLTNAPPHEEVFGFGLVGPRQQARPSARAEGERRRQSRQLGDLKLELSFALADSRTEPDREAMVALIHALTPLKWSDPKITFLLHLNVEVVNQELDVPTSPVCADMKSWVASGYETLTPISREIASRSEGLLKQSFEAIAIGQTGVQPFPGNLAPYENAADRTLARHLKALTAQLRKRRDGKTTILKRLEAAVGLPAAKIPKIKLPAKKPVVVARGRTAAGGSFVARAERHSSRVCALFVSFSEPSRPAGGGLLEILNGGGTARCLSKSHVHPEQAVHCNSGLLTIEANLLPATRSVRLLLSDNHTITSPAIRVPASLGGPAGLYYQVVRGPSPIPVSLTELDEQGRTVAILKLPAVVECSRNLVKYVAGGIVSLAHGSLPQGPTFTIRGERYRELGHVHFELKLEASNEQLFGGGGEGGGLLSLRLEEGSRPPGKQPFQPQTSNGCEPQPYVIIYGLLKAPGDTVLARVAGGLVSLSKVAIPAHLHAGGVLAYGAFSPIPTELVIRDGRGRTIDTRDLSEAAKSNAETCEGEAEG